MPPDDVTLTPVYHDPFRKGEHMSNEQNTEQQNAELTWEQQQQAEQDDAQRRIANIHLDEAEKRAAAKRTKNLGQLSDDELRRLTRQWGFEAI
jgi:hypothetical protein